MFTICSFVVNQRILSQENGRFVKARGLKQKANYRCIADEKRNPPGGVEFLYRQTRKEAIKAQEAM